MQCQKTQESLSAYLDGMLDPLDQKTVEGHLEQCPVCRLELDDLKMVVGLVQNLPLVDSPKEFRQALMRRIQQIDGQDRKVGFVTKLSKGRASGLMAVAASFLLVIGVAAHWYGLPWKYDQLGRNSQMGSYPVQQEGSDSSIAKSKVATEGISNSELSDKAGLAVHTQSDGGRPLGSDSNAAIQGLKNQQEGVTNLEEGTAQDRKAVAGKGLTGMAARGNTPFSILSEPEQPKQVSIGLEVLDKIKAAQEVSGIVQRLGGSTLELMGTTESRELVVMVPEAMLDQALIDISKTGRVTRQDYTPAGASSDTKEPAKITGVGSEVYQIQRFDNDGSKSENESPSDTLAPSSGAPVEKEAVKPEADQQKPSSPVLVTIRISLE